MIALVRGYQEPACHPLSTPWRGGVYAFAFTAVPVLAYVWPLAFPILVPVLGGLLLPLWARGERAWPTFALLAALALWGAGTLAWSPALAQVRSDDPESQFGLKLLLQAPAYGFFAAAAASLSGRAAARALTILAFGLVGLGVVLALEGATSARGYQAIMAALGDPIRPDLAERNVGKGQFVMVLLAWPVFVFLRDAQERLIPVLAAGLLICPFLLNEQAPLAGLAAGGAAFLLVRGGGALGARVVGGLLALQVLVSPWLVRAAVEGGLFNAAKTFAPPSWDARLDIWGAVSAAVLQRPGLGWGLEASRMVPGVPLHPHNAGLQVWLELGAVGAVLFALIWLRVFESVARLARRDRAAAAGCAGAAGAYFTIGALSYGVWQEWWLALAGVTVAVCCVMVVVRDHERLAGRARALRKDDLTPL